MAAPEMEAAARAGTRSGRGYRAADDGAQDTAHDAVERVLAALRTAGCTPRRSGREWVARCPAHDDRTPSLGIAEGADARALLVCRAGCATEAVLDALGLKLRDLAPPGAARERARASRPRRETQPPEWTDLGPPTDAQVAALVADRRITTADTLARLGVRRVRAWGTEWLGIPTVGGGFKLWGFDASGRKRLEDGKLERRNLGPVDLVLSPDLAADTAQRRARVWDLEGESDLLAWVDAGGTCALAPTGGAGSTVGHDRHQELLAGIADEAVVVRDLDDAGREGAERSAARWLEAGVPVRVLVLPSTLGKGGDVRDFLLGRADLEPLGGVADLAALAGATPERVGTAEPASPPVAPSWPSPLDDAAFIGPLGDFVRALAPHTEADPAALLVQALAAFGSVAGRHRYYAVEGDRHYANLFASIVGDTSKGRKGTSWGRTQGLLKGADETWQTASGLSSGEGLIWAVRDRILKRERVKGGGYEDVEADPGVTDKRLLVVESELAQTLKVLAREGNTLSPVIRAAWDSGELRSLTKNSPARAAGAHISIIGHVTAQELRRELNATEAANGFANRFLFVAARRARELPFGGRADALDLGPILRRLADALERAREPGPMAFDAAARERWASVYSDLSRGRPGLLGAVTGRAEAQVVRLALVYALSEGAGCIGLRHLDAALAVWRYCLASAAYVFGDSLGDRVADAALAAIRAAGAEGVSRTDLRDLLGKGHGERLTAALATLAAAGLAHGRRVRTARDGSGGRPAECWYPGRDPGTESRAPRCGNGAASDPGPFPKSPKSPEYPSADSGSTDSGDSGDSGEGEPFGVDLPPLDDDDAPEWAEVLA